MRSPAAAMAWEFRRRHRWGFLGVLGYFVALAIVRLLIFHGGSRVDFDDLTFALLVIVPLSSTIIYFLGVFSFGLSGDLAARQSIYPARMFTLPVTSASLTGWPMLFGSVSVAVLWFATRLLGVWPYDVEVPVVWPALLGASLLAWTQALTWMPYALPGLRVIVTVLWLVTFDAIIMLALYSKASEPLMLTLLAPHLPLAYLVARFALRRARGGDVPDWRPRIFRGRRRLAEFSSPSRAQLWFEWRQHGRSLPWLMTILLPFELAMLFAFRSTPALIFETVILVLFTPPIMAAFVAATVRQPLTPFTSTRPLGTVPLIAAKLKAALWSTLASWLVVLVAVPVALMLSGTADVVLERAHRLGEVMGTPRAIGIVLLALFALMASTWKQLVQSLYIGMSGREWVVKTSVFATLSLLAIILPVAYWLTTSRRAAAALWTCFPWIAAVLVCFKLSIAAWIALRLRDKGLLDDRTLVKAAIGWDLAVFALYGMLVWIFPALLLRRYFLALIAILAVPLARLAAAPLALDWSRHR